MIWSRVWSKLEGRDYLRNVLTLVSGSGLAQAIPIAVAPILTRLYTPEDFALLALFMSVAGLFSVAATARYEMAVLLPKTDGEAAGLVFLSLAIAGGLSLTTLVPLLFWHHEIAALLGNPRVSHWLFLVPLSIFSTGAFRTISYWANRKLQYKRIAYMRVSQTGSASFFQVGAGFPFGSGGFLIVGQVLGQVVAGSAWMLQTWKETTRQYAETKPPIRALARKYRDFPLVNTPHALVDTIQSSGIVFIISAMFGEVILGFYALTMRILQGPLNLVGSAFGQVYYQQAAQTFNKGASISGLLKSTTKRLFAISAPFFMLLAIAAPSLFAIVFGEQWREAGVYAQILIPWMALRFIVAPVSQTPIILGRQKAAFAFGVIGNLLMLLAIIIGGALDDFKAGLLMLSMAMIAHLTVYLLWLLRISTMASLENEGVG